MKQNFTHFFFLAFFVALLMPSSVRAEDIPVAILTTNADGKTKTLTFTYADQSTLNQPGNGQDGTYELNSGENRPGWFKWNNDIVTKVVFTDAFAEARPTTTYYWFAEMNSLATIEGISNLNTEEVTDMMGMFSSCRKLESIDISGFNTSKVTNMQWMFNGCSSLTSIDVSRFDMSNVINMGGMFSLCSKLQSIDISNFDMSKVQYASGFLANCWSLRVLTVGNNDFGNFSNNISSNNGFFSEIGYGWPCKLIIGSNFNKDVLGEKSEQGTYVWKRGIFTLSDSVIVPIAQVITNVDGMTKTLKFSMREVNVSKLDEYKAGQTYPLNESEGVLPGWFPSYSDTTFTSVVFDISFVKARPKTTNDWFDGMTRLKSITGIEYLNTSETTNMHAMFGRCKSLQEIDVSDFNTEKVKNMNGMFILCSNLIKIDISNFNTDQVQSTNQMFWGCTSLKDINLCIFKNNRWREMWQMFYGCSSLTSIDISNWGFYIGTGSAAGTDIYAMFKNCTGLSTLILGANDLRDVKEADKREMFAKVGMAETPCNLIINENFDKSVLGDKINDGSYSYYLWQDGYFAEPTVVPTAIESISMDKGLKLDTPAYNLSGQRVGKDYKGIVIQKGHKYVRR